MLLIFIFVSAPVGSRSAVGLEVYVCKCLHAKEIDKYGIRLNWPRCATCTNRAALRALRHEPKAPNTKPSKATRREPDQGNAVKIRGCPRNCKWRGAFHCSTGAKNPGKEESA